MNIAPQLLEKYNVPVPRYTSYPPANHFDEQVTGAEMLELIRSSNNWAPDHIGFYIHIPFCRKICFYCGCNACTLKSTSEVTRYVEALKQEIRLVAKALNRSRKVTQIHFGGGTPNSIPAEMLEEIVRLISSSAASSWLRCRSIISERRMRSTTPSRANISWGSKGLMM